MVYFEIIEELGKIKQYYSKWDELFISCDCEASLSIEWTQALLETHLRDARFFLVVLKRSDEIVGIVPMCIRKARRFGLSLLTLMPVAEYFNTHSDLLLTEISDELIEALLQVLSGSKYEWDIFRMNRLVESNPLVKRIASGLRKRSAFRFDLRKAEPSFFIELDGSYEEFLAKRSTNFRHKLKSVAKRINALADVTFSKTEDFKKFADAYEIILSIEKNSWKHPHGTAITCSEKQREFYRVLGQSAFDKGRLRLCILRRNGDPIAFEMGLVKNKKYYGVHGSYDEKFKNENPGTALFARFIEDLCHDGINEYDWFGEPFEFQSRWTDKLRRHTSLLIYNKTPKAKLFFIFNKIREGVRGDGQAQVRLHDPRGVRPEKT